MYASQQYNVQNEVCFLFYLVDYYYILFWNISVFKYYI